MRIPVLGGRSSRLAKLTAIPVIGLVLAACTEQANSNPTGDDAAPGLIGETANGIGFPHEVVTTEGIQAAGLYLPIFLIAVAIFILVEGLLLFMVWRFRRKDGDDSLPEQMHGNNKLEVIWTVIPAIIVTGLFVASTIVLTETEAQSDSPDVVVDIEAFRFGWKFDYDNGIQIAGGGREGAPQMVLPIDETIRFRLTAVDVIHSWYVPAFFFKRDAVPGRLNVFEMTIEKPGVYGGQCAEFCGLAHGDMFFSVRAMEGDEYDAWVTEQGGDVSLSGTTASDELAEADGESAETDEATDASEAEGIDDASTETSEEEA